MDFATIGMRKNHIANEKLIKPQPRPNETEKWQIVISDLDWKLLCCVNSTRSTHKILSVAKFV